MTDRDTPQTGWSGFWRTGGFSRAILVALVYLALYLGIGAIVGGAAGSYMTSDELFADARSVLLALALPVSLGSLILIAFARSIDWLPSPLFDRTTITIRRWWWIGPIFLTLTIAFRLVGIDYAHYGAGVVAAAFFSGIFIGFSEEILSRGIVVQMIRNVGHGEWFVMIGSSLIFAGLHSANLLTGQPVLTVVATMGFTFGFGIIMYLTLRLTGSLIWPMVLHGLTDPTTFLATGGIDVAESADRGHTALLAFAGIATFAYLIVAVIALLFLRHLAKPSTPENFS